MKLHRPRRATAALVLLLAAACNTGSSGPGDSPTGPLPAIILTPDPVVGGSTISMRAGVGSTASVLQLEIFATDIVNLQAADFTLLYPDQLFRYDGFQRGDFIGAGAQVITGTTGPGTVTFDLLRTTPAPATGSGPMLFVTFTAIGAGDGRFDFFEPFAEDQLGLEITGIDWAGAAVRVVL